MTIPEEEAPKPVKELEAALIRRARLARRLTIPEAATRAGISHQRWSQIEHATGNQAPAETIAHMCDAVGITAGRLAVLRPTAAEILQEIGLQRATDEHPDDRRIKELVAGFPEEQRAVVVEFLDNLNHQHQIGRRLIETLVGIELRPSGQE